MSQSNLFMDTMALKPTSRRPIWVMRQAGRYLPDYRKVRQRHSFNEMVETPELAVEITLQPIHRYGLDAAIIFSDILVLLAASGVNYKILEKQGPVLERAIRTEADFASLSTAPASDFLGYVYEAITLTRKELPEDKALLGFAGAPWTLASYLIEGGSSKGGFPAIKAMFNDNPGLFGKIMDRITANVIHHLNAQLDAGASAVQVFDSWAGMSTKEVFREAALPYLMRIADELQGKPVIFFPKGAGNWLTRAEAEHFGALGVDWTHSMGHYRETFGPDMVLQGNLDPAILKTDEKTIRRAAIEILESHGSEPGHIFNLGHGITPDVPVEHLGVLVETVQNYQIGN